MDFDTAFNILVDPAHEGGYVNNRQDKGGATRYGITEATARRNGYTGLMQGLPLATAKAIYRKEYWAASGCDAVPDVAKFQALEMGVNCGPGQSVRNIQRAAYTTVDGQLGPRTLQAIQSMDPTWFYLRFCAGQELYYTGLNDWPAFGRGWSIRLANNMLNNVRSPK
jgi:lysozyme family protein